MMPKIFSLEYTLHEDMTYSHHGVMERSSSMGPRLLKGSLRGLSLVLCVVES